MTPFQLLKILKHFFYRTNSNSSKNLKPRKCQSVLNVVVIQTQWKWLKKCVKWDKTDCFRDINLGKMGRIWHPLPHLWGLIQIQTAALGPDQDHQGGFQLLDLIITDWWKSYWSKKNPLQDLLSSQNTVISTNLRRWIITDHVTFKLGYNQI